MVIAGRPRFILILSVVKNARKLKGIWQKIEPYFTPDQFTNPEKMSGILLMILWDLRFHSGWEIIIHPMTADKHVDFHFKPPNGSFTFREQAKYLQSYLEEMQLDDSCGLGLYPDQDSPGFRLDIRDKKARWLYQGREYLPLSRFGN